MESSVEYCDLDLISKGNECYFKGKYHNCVTFYQMIQKKVQLSKFTVKIYHVDESEFICLIRNNILISKGLALNWDLTDMYETWSCLLENFIQLFQEMKALHIVSKIPMKYYLNVVHNVLWWGWWHPRGLQHDNSHVETCIEIAIECFKRVLERCEEPFSSTSFGRSEETVLCIMKKIATKLLQFNEGERLQLLELFVIVVHILVESKKNEAIVECIDCMNHILSTKHKIPSDVLLPTESKETDVKEWKNNFKFGFSEINSTVEKCSVKTVVDVLEITYCFCLIENQQYVKCVAYMDASDKKDTKFQFLWNYMKAFACYCAGDSEASLLCLATMEHFPASQQMKVRYSLLRGSVLAQKGRHTDALRELFKPLSLDVKDDKEKDFYPITLYLISKQYEALCSKYEGYCRGELKKNIKLVNGKTKLNQGVSLYDSMLADHVDSLHHLVQVLQVNGDSDRSNVNRRGSFDLEQRILNIFHPQEEINLSLALYMLATRLALIGNIGAAAETFMELLEQPDLQSSGSLVEQLPHVSVIYHSAITTLLRSNKLQQAEELCRKAVSYYSCRSCEYQDTEHSLLCLEDDLVALMLLAHVYKRKREETQESEVLDRCLGLIHNNKHWTDDSLKCSTTQKNVDAYVKLLNALKAKLHLQKAHNYLRRGNSFNNDAFYEFKQATLSNPDDKDLIESYRQFLEANEQYCNHNNLVSLKQHSGVDILDNYTLALKFLLQPNVAQESHVDIFVDS